MPNHKLSNPTSKCFFLYSARHVYYYYYYYYYYYCL